MPTITERVTVLEAQQIILLTRLSAIEDGVSSVNTAILEQTKEANRREEARQARIEASEAAAKEAALAAATRAQIAEIEARKSLEEWKRAQLSRIVGIGTPVVISVIGAALALLKGCGG